MKTLGFAEIIAEITEDGQVTLLCYSPTLGHCELNMSADELMIFIVEAGNTLADARRRELEKRQEKELKREQER